MVRITPDDTDSPSRAHGLRSGRTSRSSQLRGSFAAAVTATGAHDAIAPAREIPREVRGSRDVRPPWLHQRLPLSAQPERPLRALERATGHDHAALHARPRDSPAD